MFPNRNESLEDSNDSQLQNIPEIIFDCQEGESLQLIWISDGNMEVV